MVNGFELHDVHAENAEREKWYILSTKVDYPEYNRNALPANK